MDNVLGTERNVLTANLPDTWNVDNIMIKEDANILLVDVFGWDQGSNKRIISLTVVLV